MIKCLTLHQPWATLIAIGAKKIETRSWWTGYRGPLAISASAKWDLDEWFFTTQGGGSWQTIRDALAVAGYVGFEGLKQLPLGSILCICDLVNVVPITEDNAPPEPERSFGDYTPGRYAWHLANVRALPEPIPAKGQLGLWTPAPAILETLGRFYKGAA